MSCLWGCQLKSWSHNNAEFLLKAIKKETPSIVLLETAQVLQILNTPEWKTIKLLLQEKNIAFCGIGEIPPSHLAEEVKSLFHKFFLEPINIEELINFMRAKIEIIYERRNGDRRQVADRRNQVIASKTINELLPITTSLNSGNGINLVRHRNIRSLSIDYDANSVSINAESINVSPKEFQLIDLLAKNTGYVVASGKLGSYGDKLWRHNIYLL